MALDDICTPIVLAEDGSLSPAPATTVESLRADRWYVLRHPQSRLHPGMDHVLSHHASMRPDVDIFYGDEAVVRSGRITEQVICKPAFDHSQLLAQDYVGSPVFAKGSALIAVGGPNRQAGTAVIFDLVLRAVSLGLVVDRMTEVVAAHPSKAPRAATADRLAALERYLARSAPDCRAGPGRRPDTFRLSRDFVDRPHVTLIVPTAQSADDAPGAGPVRAPYIVGLLDSLAAGGWPADRLTVLIGDDVADGAIYRDGAWPFEIVRVVTTRPAGEPFNYARKMNALWRAARTEHLVLMNDDMVIRTPDWLDALMTFAVDETVGGVGARLLFPDGRIQHVGMPGGVMTVCTHAFVGLDGDAPTYQNWADVQREWSIVTGALFATRRSLLEQINGFDERFSLEYNDVDMCLRMRLLGYRIVYTPFAELTHFESVTRGKRRPPADEVALFMERWNEYLRDDPAYNPRLVRDTPIIAPAPRFDDWWLSGRDEAAGPDLLPRRRLVRHARAAIGRVAARLSGLR